MVSITHINKKRGRPRKKFEDVDQFIAYETDCDVLNSFDEDEVPPAIRLKRPDDFKVEPTKNVVMIGKGNTQVSEFLASSALHNSITGNIPLSDDLPDADQVIIGGYVSKYTKRRMLTFLQAIREGLSVVQASRLIGMDPDMMQNSIEENRYNLKICVEIAKEEHRLFHVKRVNNSEYGYQCSTWMLERKYRDDYGREVKITNGSDAPKQKVKFGNREIEF